MNIVGVEEITYGVGDLAACTRFFIDWGLIDRGDGSFATGEGTVVRLRSTDDPMLPAFHHHSPFFDGSCGREVIWGVEAETDLRSIADGLGRDREVADEAGVLRTNDDGGNSIGFMVTRRQAGTLTHPAINTVGSAARTNRQADGTRPELATPQRINHVVYLSTGDTEAQTRFYIDRLGFKLSDRIGDGGYFMRAPGSADHHNLLLENFGEGHYGLQHAAFEFRDFDQIMHRGSHVESRGWQSHIGPTRHTLGSNYSWYFWTPAGGLVELISDMDVLTEEWEPRHMDPKTAGPPHAWYARPEQKAWRFGKPHG